MMAKITNINHIAIAVEDLDAAIVFWRDVLGLELSHIEDVPSQKSQVAFFPTGNSEIELVKPTSEDTGVAKFLQKHGPGMHHICMQVDDIEEMLELLKEKGVILINPTPIELPGRKLAFIHPKSSNGVLLELYQLTDQTDV